MSMNIIATHKCCRIRQLVHAIEAGSYLNQLFGVYRHRYQSNLQFNGVGRSSARTNAHTHTQDKATGTQKVIVLSRRENDGASDDQQRPAAHTDTTTKHVVDGTREQCADHVTSGIEHHDDTSVASEFTITKVLLVLCHCVDG